MTCSFDIRYTQLRAMGAAGWAAENHCRSLRKAGAMLDLLARLRHLAPRGAEILEIGCGNGALARKFRRLGFLYTGLDISPTAIRWAQDLNRNTPQVRFRHGDVRRMPTVADGTMQFVYDSGCFHCLVGRDRQKALSQIHRVLKPGGIFVMSSMCGLPRGLSEDLTFDRSRSIMTRDGLPYRTLKPLASLRYEPSPHGFICVWSTVSANAWWDHATIVFRRQ